MWFLGGQAAVGQQVAPPVVFVHGICSTALDWQAFSLAVVAQLNTNYPSFYPDTTVYSAVASSSSPDGVQYYDMATGENVSTPTASSRFFAISFHDPDNPGARPGAIDGANVMNTSIAEKGDELSALIAAVKKLTGAPKVALVAHSMGGLDSRSYLENLGTVLSHVPGGDTDVVMLTTLDTPHMGSPIATAVFAGDETNNTLLDLIGFFDPCEVAPSANLIELEIGSSTLNKLNSAAGAANLPDTVAFDSIASFDYASPLSLDERNWIYPLTGGACSLALQGDPNDGVVCLESQILDNALNSYPNLSSLRRSRLIDSYSDSCPNGDGTYVLHQLGCMGTIPAAQSQVTADIINNFLNNSIDIEPQNAAVAPGQKQLFTATLNGAAIPVYWTLLENPASTLIDFNGNFASETEGTYNVVATDIATGRQYGSAAITVGQAAQNTTLSVTFSGNGKGILTSSPISLNCVASCSASFPTGTSVTLTASPNSGSVVSSWTKCDQYSGNTCVVAMSASRAVIVAFSTEESVDLAAPVLTPVQVTGSGSSLQAAFAWSQVTHNAGYRLLVAASQAALPSDPNNADCAACMADLTFSANTITYTMPAGLLQPGNTYYWEVHALAAQPYSPGAWPVPGSFSTGQSVAEVQVSVVGDGSGSVTSSPAGINCPGTCSATFAPNTTVTLSEGAAQGSAFQGWGGVCSGSSCSISATGAQEVVADFTRPSSYQLTLGVAGSGKVRSTDGEINCTNTGGACSAVYANGASVTLNASPATSYQFSGWSNACAGTAPCSLTMNQNWFALGLFTLSQTANGKMVVSPSSFAPQFTQGSSPASIGLAVTSNSGQPMVGNAVASEQTGGNWISIDGHESESWTAPVTHVITFNPAGLSPGTYEGSITLTSAQASNSPVVVPVTLTVVAPLTITSPAVLPDAFSGKPYSVQLAETGGTGLKWQIEQGGLPLGLSLNSSTGVISGTPTQIVGNTPETFTISLTDAQGQYTYQAFTMNWRGGVIVTMWNESLQQMIVGNQVTASAGTTFVATGGVAPYTWSVQEVPPGVSISQSGAFTGAPTTTGSYTMVLTATDSTGLTGSATIPVAVTMNALKIVTGSITNPPVLSPVVVGTSVGIGIGAQGGTQSGYVWSISGTLPTGITAGPIPGCTASNCGLYFSGTPATAGNFSFTVKVTDSGNNTASNLIVWVVNTNTSGPKITTKTLPLATITNSYSHTLTATGGKAPLTWKLVTESLDPDIAVTTAGVISGKASITNDCYSGPGYFMPPTFPAPMNFVVEVTDANGASDEAELCLPSYFPQQVLTSVSPSTVVATGEPQTLTVNGSGFVSGSQVWIEYAGFPTTFVSPTKLKVKLAPAISGLFAAGNTGLVAGNWPIRVQGNYMLPSSFSNLTLSNPQPTISSVQGSYGTTGSPCTPNFTCILAINGSGLVSNSTLQVTGSSTSQALDVYTWPTSLEPWNQLTFGVFNAPQPGTYTVVVTNANQPNGEQPATAESTFVVAQDGDIVPSPASLAATVTQGGVPATAALTVQVAGAVNNPGTFAVSTQNGGSWLTVAGQLTGGWTMGEPLAVGMNPTNLAPGVYTGTITLSVSTAPDGSVSVPVTMTVLAPLTITTTSPLPTATHGSPYLLTLQASENTGLTWMLAKGQGTLPTGLTLNTSTGTISGTPTSPSGPITAAFTVGVTDANGRTYWEPFTMPWQ